MPNLNFLNNFLKDIKSWQIYNLNIKMAPNLRQKNRQVKFIDFTEEIKKSFSNRDLPKKPRTKLELWQIAALEKAFEDDSHPSLKGKKRLSDALGLQIKSIQIWFQNRRAKEKSKREQDETESESSIHYSSEDEHKGGFQNQTETQPNPSERREEREPPNNLSKDPVFSSTDINHLSMSYDECYSNVCSIFDKSASTYSEYDSFLSSFSSPICMPTERPETEKSESEISASESFFTNDRIFKNTDQYKCHFINGKITYKENETVSFFNELQQHMNNNII